MRFCTQCGAQLEEGQRFCKKCGAPVRVGESTLTASMTNVGGDAISDVDAPAEAEGTMCSENGSTPVGETLQVKEVFQAEQGPQVEIPTRVEHAAPSPMLSDKSSEAGRVEDAPEEQPPARKRKGKGKLIAIIVVLLVVISGAAGGAMLYFSGKLPFLQPQQAEALPLSRNVRLVPKAADGSSPLHYFVRVKRAVDTAGNEVDVSLAPELEVTGSTGFIPNDLIADLPDGTYTFEVETEGEIFELSPVDLGENGTGEGEGPIEIQQEASTEAGATEEASADEVGEETLKTADELFLEKIEELKDEFGEPEVKVAELPDEQANKHLAYASGLSFAQFIDFGDNVERLVAIYLDPNIQGAPKYSDYYVEVWEFDKKNHKLVCSYGENGSAPLSDGSLNEDESASFVNFAINSTDYKTVLSYSSSKDFYINESYVGIRSDGNFGLIHNIVTEPHTEGSTLLRTYYVDGYEKSGDEVADAEKSVYGHMEITKYRWYQLTWSYPTQEEAQTGLRPQVIDGLNEGDYYFPGDLVAQVGDTVETLQGRVGEADSRQESADASKIAAAEVTEVVEISTFYSGTDESEGTERYTWGYLELTDGAEDEVLASINAVLQDEYEDVKRETANWKPSTAINGECTSYRSLLTCDRDGLLGTCVMQYRTKWGAHGSSEAHGHIFDLSSGKELSPWEVAGMSEAELDDAAVKAIASYVMDNPGSIAYTSEVEAKNDARAAIEGCEYLLTNDGIVVSLQAYAMHYPYQDVTNKIVVWAFDDSSMVGTNVADQFDIDFWS